MTSIIFITLMKMMCVCVYACMYFRSVWQWCVIQNQGRKWCNAFSSLFCAFMDTWIRWIIIMHLNVKWGRQIILGCSWHWFYDRDDQKSAYRMSGNQLVLLFYSFFSAQTFSNAQTNPQIRNPSLKLSWDMIWIVIVPYLNIHLSW